MNRVQNLLSSHVAVLDTLVAQSALTEERRKEIEAGTVKITSREAEMISTAAKKAFSAELLLQLNADDLASGKKKSPTTRTSKSPSVKIGPYGQRQVEW